MRILRPGEARYPFRRIRPVGERDGIGPVGVELVDPGGVTLASSRRIGAVSVPAYVVFDRRVIDHLAMAVTQWTPPPTSDSFALQSVGVRALEGAVEAVLATFDRSVSIWKDADCTKEEVARAFVEELHDENILERRPHRWVKNVINLEVWRVANYLVLEDNG